MKSITSYSIYDVVAVLGTDVIAVLASAGISKHVYYNDQKIVADFIGCDIFTFSEFIGGLQFTYHRQAVHSSCLLVGENLQINALQVDGDDSL